jgi:hypothetical protein
MKSILSRIKFYLRRVYRLSIDAKKWEDIVWNDLKQIHQKAEWHSGVHEREKYIETIFNISKDAIKHFYYCIYDNNFVCRVTLLEDFDEELVSDIFILATHFNNLLKRGQVVVNPKTKVVEYYMKDSLLIFLLFTHDLYNQTVVHHQTSKDIYVALNRLVNEGESPAIIIADLINNKNQEDEESSSPNE